MTPSLGASGGVAARRLEGKIALVTGGSRGIGAAIVKRFLKEGATVHFTYRAALDEAEKTAALGSEGKVFYFACDGRDKKDVERAVERVMAKEDRIDILVNNAGIIRDGLFLTMRDEDWSDVLDTNLGSTYFFSKAAAKQMLMQRQGRIINISSIVGELGGFGQANYAASKGAVNALTKSLASEFASRNITVNAVAPGMVATDMSSAVRSALGEKIKEKIPVGSFAE